MESDRKAALIITGDLLNSYLAFNAFAVAAADFIGGRCFG